MQDRDDTPSRALRRAAHAGQENVIERLIAEGVDVNAWDQYGRNALTFAAQAGHLKIVHMLLNSGAWVDPFVDDGVFMTPLMCAAEHGHVEIAEALLDAGADPTKHGGIGLVTAEYYARVDGRFGYLAAILRRAEDQWRKKHST